METIRNYLDTMFANMPNTPAVIRAREELWQMMEDKYNELIEEGKTQNEAVGTVISEFGNLSELAEAIGIEEEVKEVEEKAETETVPQIIVNADEAKEYMKDKAESAFKRSLGVCLIILSFVGIIIGEIILPESLDAFEILFFFGFIAAGVVLIVLSNVCLKNWEHLKSDKFALSMDATKAVIEDKDNFSKNRTIYLTVGVMLCAMCWLPAAFLSELVNSKYIDNLSGAMVFIFIGIGVMLIVYQAQILEGYGYLLKTVSKEETLKASYSPKKKNKMGYKSVGVQCVMSVYWATVTCVYLMLSFVFVGWLWTWLIWPIASVAHMIIDRNLLVDLSETEQKSVFEDEAKISVEDEVKAALADDSDKEAK